LRDLTVHRGNRASPGADLVVLGGLAYYLFQLGLNRILCGLFLLVGVGAAMGISLYAISLAHRHRDRLKFIFGVVQAIIACALIGYIAYSFMTDTASAKDFFAGVLALFTGKRGYTEAADGWDGAPAAPSPT
jgi:hypothetical protein